MPEPPALTLSRRHERRALLAAAGSAWLGGGVAVRHGEVHAQAASQALLQAHAPAARAPLLVGPGGDVPRIADALRLAQDGDTLHVLPGTYAGDVAVITQRRLLIIGIGERPVLDAAGQHAEGKATWVVRNGDIEIRNIAFRGARVPDHNGAGIRFEAGRLRLQGCLFTDNQMGLLTGNREDAELLVDDCEFSHAPDNPDALPHLLYVGRIARLTLRNSRLHHGRIGHLLKCRAREALITGNVIDDGADGRASYEIDLPNGGLAEITHNLIGQGLVSENAVMLAYGAEAKRYPAWPVNRLVLAHNRFIDRRPAGGVFVRTWPDQLPPDAEVDSHDNQLLGAGRLMLGAIGRSRDDPPGPLPR